MSLLKYYNLKTVALEIYLDTDKTINEISLSHARCRIYWRLHAVYDHTIVKVIIRWSKLSAIKTKTQKMIYF